MAYNYGGPIPPYKAGFGKTPTGGGNFGAGGVGSNFSNLISGAPNAAIQRPIVSMPNRGDFGPTAIAPTIDTKGIGIAPPSTAGLVETAHAARTAEAGFNNPRGTQAFQNLMSLANERTAAQESEIGRHAADAAQRRGYAGGFEDSAASAQADRMQALAETGFAGASQIRQEEGEMYGKAIGAFAQLQSAYNQAKTSGDIAYANNLTQQHIAQAQAHLQAMDINSHQAIAYAGAVNDAKKLQAQLDSAYNSQLIDNNRYIQGQYELSSRLMLQREALAAQERAQDKTLAARRYEFDKDLGFKEKQFGEQKREFDTKLKADPNTAYRAFTGLA